jgi:hypothetical protein
VSTQSHIVTRDDIVQLWDAINNLRDRLPDVPALEKTQANKDTRAYVEKYGCACPSMVLNGMTCYTSDIWHAALAYERAEVGKMLPAANVSHYVYKVSAAIQAIRARCGGAK